MRNAIKEGKEQFFPHMALVSFPSIIASFTPWLLQVYLGNNLERFKLPIISHFC